MEANFSVITTIRSNLPRPELLMAPFLNSQLTLTHQLEWDFHLQMPPFSGGLIHQLFKNS